MTAVTRDPELHRSFQTVVIDPKIFIRPPFRRCPRCGQEGVLGVLSISGLQCLRRCKACRYDVFIALPPLKKKILYLDQFAISNMMKALNPADRAHGKAELVFYLELFRIIDRLCKLQLLICPSSQFLDEESHVAPSFEPFKRMYDLLSGGVVFRDDLFIQQLQLYRHAQLWAMGHPETSPTVVPSEVLDGNADIWRERFQVTVQRRYPQEWIDELRRQREEVSEENAELFLRWGQQRLSFSECFANEVKSYGEITLWLSENRPNVSNLLRVKAVSDGLEKAGVPLSELSAQIAAYFRSTSLEFLPSLRIQSALCAALAHEARSGRKKPPSREMATDIKAIAAFLPYCDAMLVDDECRRLLSLPKAREKVGFPCKIFSQAGRDELLGYLLEMESSADPAHLSIVADVYGPDWGRPFESLYTWEGANTAPRPGSASEDGEG